MEDRLSSKENHSKGNDLWYQACRDLRANLRKTAELYRYIALRLRYPQLRTGLVFMGRGVEINILPNAQVHFGKRVHFLSNFSGIFGGAVEIGDNVFFNKGCHVVALNSLVIGDNSLFGEMVSIHDENHATDINSTPLASRGIVAVPVVIGRNVWVGAKVTILQGVQIGDNAVIGANAVVTHDIPSNSVAVGIPAKVVKNR